MAVTLGINTSTGAEIPFWFTRTDSKGFLNYFFTENVGNIIAQHFVIDITPLHKIAGREEEPLDSFLARDPTEERRQYWYKHRAENEAAWQSPKILLHVLDQLLKALQSHPDVYKQLNLIDDYFIEGFFMQDVHDLYQMVEWADQQNIDRIRLEIG